MTGLRKQLARTIYDNCGMVGYRCEQLADAIIAAHLEDVRERVLAVAAEHRVVDADGWRCACGQSAPQDWPRHAHHLADLVLAEL